MNSNKCSGVLLYQERWNSVNSQESYSQRHSPDIRSQNLRIISSKSPSLNRHARQTRPPEHRQHLLSLLRIELHYPHSRVHGRRIAILANHSKEKTHIGRSEVLQCTPRNYIKVLIDAVRYCHEYSVIHRDIKVFKS